MPLLLWPLLAGGVGFGGGFLASNGLNNLVKLTLLAGGGFIAYQVYQGSKT